MKLAYLVWFVLGLGWGFILTGADCEYQYGTVWHCKMNFKPSNALERAPITWRW